MKFNQKIESIQYDFHDQFEQYCNTYIDLLQKWGKIHNLTAELDDYAIQNNIIDSILPLEFIDSFESFADIGTGAGYPGLILAMAKPDVKTYLIEPRNKRVAFLTFVKNALGLKNVEIICDRVERVEHINVDLITSRAVTNTALLLKLTQNITSNNTSFLFYKGSMLQTELEEAKVNNYKIVNVNDRNYLYIKG